MSDGCPASPSLYCVCTCIELRKFMTDGGIRFLPSIRSSSLMTTTCSSRLVCCPSPPLSCCYLVITRPLDTLDTLLPDSSEMQTGGRYSWHPRISPTTWAQVIMELLQPWACTILGDGNLLPGNDWWPPQCFLLRPLEGGTWADGVAPPKPSVIIWHGFWAHSQPWCGFISSGIAAIHGKGTTVIDWWF